MKLIQFLDDKDRRVFINPEKVSYVMEHKKGGFTYLYIDSTRADAQMKILVVGSIETITSKLLLND